MPDLMPITYAELVDLRSAVGKMACEMVCKVERVTSRTSDGVGTGVPVYTTISTTQLAGVIAPSGTGGTVAGSSMNRMMNDFAGKITSQIFWSVNFPWGSNIIIGDKITLPDGVIMWVEEDISEQSYSTLLTMHCTTVQP